MTNIKHSNWHNFTISTDNNVHAFSFVHGDEYLYLSLNNPSNFERIKLSDFQEVVQRINELASLDKQSAMKEVEEPISPQESSKRIDDQTNYALPRFIDDLNYYAHSSKYRPVENIFLYHYNKNKNINLNNIWTSIYSNQYDLSKDTVRMCLVKLCRKYGLEYQKNNVK